MFRGYRPVRLLTALLAVLVQLNIFFVLELHHHVLDSRFLRDAATAGVSLTKSQTASAPAPLCPACQVARQGSVQPAVQKLTLLHLLLVGSALPSRSTRLPVLFLLHSSGRDPPKG